MRWEKKTDAPEDRAAVETTERLDPRQMESLALGHHTNRRVGLGCVVPGRLGRTYRDPHRTIEQLGCGAGQERDGMGEPAPGIPIITTLPRSRHGDY